MKKFGPDRIIELKTPLSMEDIINLRSGDRIEISGYIYTARDTAHKRMMELVKADRELPFPVKGQVIYYVGPSPAPPGRVIGSAGPTTSYRMDPYTPKLLEMGLKGMIGKGRRSDAVREAMVRYKAVYMAATGGAGALISRAVRESITVAYEDLGPEAVRRLKVERFPVIVVNDILGNDYYEEGHKQYQILS